MPGPAGTSTGPLIAIDGVSVRFGGVMALSEVSFTIEPQQIVGLIGPNGAGKTTLFNCLSRLYQPSSGDIRVRGRSILGLQPHHMIGQGIGRTFQNVALFPSMTVRDNVMVGLHDRLKGGLLGEALRLPAVTRTHRAAMAVVGELLDLLDLQGLADRRVGGLTFATRKRVEMARALAATPAVLMLDEPAGGLNQAEVTGLEALIRRLRDERKIAVLLVEHHLNLVMNVSDRVVALEFGRKIAEGRPDDVRAHPRVLSAYLGGAH